MYEPNIRGHIEGTSTFANNFSCWIKAVIVNHKDCHLKFQIWNADVECQSGFFFFFFIMIATYVVPVVLISIFSSHTPIRW